MTLSSYPISRPGYSAIGQYQKQANDDFETWFMDPKPSNRMVLALRSGILEEVHWAMDRLMRCSSNDQFNMKLLPGLLDALFDCPEWYINEGHNAPSSSSLFSMPREDSMQRRHAISCLFILRNGALSEINTREIARFRRTLPFIEKALLVLDPLSDTNAEFLLYTLELMYAISNFISIPNSLPPNNYLYALHTIASTSSNRSLIIASLSVLSALLSNPPNSAHVWVDSPAVESCIRYLPLLKDEELVDACVNYLYVHLSVQTAAKEFLHRTEMPSVLRLLIGVVLQQQSLEPFVTELTSNAHIVPSPANVHRDRDVTQEEFQHLMTLPEPDRCHSWIKMMFEPNPAIELTQVEVWNLYKALFDPHGAERPLLPASEVIKSVSDVFSQAQAMVLTEITPPRFVVRGVGRRKDLVDRDRFKCHWDRSLCPSPSLQAVSELHDHILSHLSLLSEPTYSCLWASCPVDSIPRSRIRSHVLTHVYATALPSLHDSQCLDLTIASTDHYPMMNPTLRTPPPLKEAKVMHDEANTNADPSSGALTALLCVRILFRAAFTATDPAPKADVDHFGFPSLVIEDDDDEEDITEESLDRDRVGQKKGRRAFWQVRWLMESVKLRDEVLMSWIDEMSDVLGTLPPP